MADLQEPRDSQLNMAESPRVGRRIRTLHRTYAQVNVAYRRIRPSTQQRAGGCQLLIPTPSTHGEVSRSHRAAAVGPEGVRNRSKSLRETGANKGSAKPIAPIAGSSSLEDPNPSAPVDDSGRAIG